MGYLNPFDDIYREESDQHPHARTLRTGFFRKIADTFFVFAGLGTQVELDGSRHVGLLDWATLGIPLLVDNISNWLINNFNGFSAIPAILFTAISIVSNIIRYSLAAILTLVASPLVLFVQAASFAASYSRKESANALPVISNTNTEEDDFGSTKSLSRVLADNNLDYENIQVDYQAITRDELQGTPTVIMDYDFYDLQDAREKAIDASKIECLILFTDAIVYQDKYTNLHHFPIDKQNMKLLRNDASDLYNNPGKYMPPQLNFREKSTLANSDAGCQCCRDGVHILASANAGQESIRANKASFDAMLQLNVGGLSRLFTTTIQDEAFKNNFPDEDDNYYRV